MKRFLALLACTAILAACGSKVSVGGILIGGVLDENQELTEVQTSFAPGQDQFNVHVLVQGIDGPVEVVGSWWYATGNQKIYESRVTVSPETPVAKFFVSNTNDWPEGKYRFELTHEEKPIGVQDFEVVATVPAS